MIDNSWPGRYNDSDLHEKESGASIDPEAARAREFLGAGGLDMKKRIQSALLALCMALTLLPTSAWADQTSGTEGSLEWTYDEDTRSLTISGTGEITAAATNSLYYATSWGKVESLTLDQGITAIGDEAFDGQSWNYLQSVTIPDSVKSIGNKAFNDCWHLTSLTIPGSVKTIGNEAFDSCSGVTSLTLAEGVESIGDSAFNYCSGVTSLTIPASVKSIGKWAFSDCNALTSVTFSGGVGPMGDNAFYGCNALTSVTFSGDVGSVGNNAFDSCPKLADVKFLGTVGTIGAGAFYNGGALSSVTFSGDVGYVESDAFFNCDALTGVAFGGKVESIENGAFSNCDALTGVTFSGDVGSIKSGAFYFCQKLTDVAFQSKVESVEDGAFSACNGVASVRFGGEVGSIGSDAFSDCLKLTSVTFGGKVGSIGSNAFAGCELLTSVAFPDEVYSIGADAFVRCRGLTRVTFSGEVGSIGSGAFSDCASLAEVAFSDKVGKIGSWAFSDCDSLTRLQIPAADSIGSGIFYNCDNLNAIYIKSAKEIDAKALDGCGGLKDVYFGGTQEEWDALGGAAILDEVKPRPAFHPDAAGLPETGAGDLETLLRLIREGVASSAGRTEVRLTADIELGGETLTIPEDCNLVLDLQGHNITSASNSPDFPAIEMLGDLTVLDSTADPAPAVTGTAVTYTSGSIIAKDGDGIWVQPGRTFRMLSGTIDAAGRGVAVYADRNDNSEYIKTTAEISGGYVKAGDSAVLVRGNGATGDIQEAVLESAAAPVISGGKEKVAGGTGITLTGATLIAGGSFPCGIYHPQDGGVEIRNTEIHAEGGIGVLMRGGDLIMWDALNGKPTKIYAGGSGQGVIGDPTTQPLPAGGIVMDQKSRFYDHEDIRVILYRNLSNLGEFTPTAYPADGFGLSKVISGDGGERYSFGRFCTVTFDLDGGEGGKVLRTTNANGEIEWPDDPVREGYVFRGWNRTRNSLVRMVSRNERFTNHCTLYAQWVPEGAYVVTFRTLAEGGTHAAEITGLDGVLLDWPRAPSWLGHVFIGWYTDPDGGTRYPFDQRFTGDTTLYAHWGDPVRPHTITFHYNDGSGKTDEIKTGNDNGQLLNWPEEPIRAGYRFKGWSWSDSYDIFPPKDFEFYEDTLLYARWIPENGFAVTFHHNNGSGDVETNRTNGSGVLAADKWPEAPKLEGYTFGGWYSSTTGGVYAGPSTVFQRDTHLYGYWIKNGSDDNPNIPKTYTVTFDPNGGSGGDTLTTGTNGRLTTLPGDPTWEGYTFDGWYTASSGGERVTTSTVFTGDSVVYAHWSQTVTPPPGTACTVTFNSQGGSAVPAQTVAAGGYAARPGDPVRSGYTFGGWFREAACTNAWSFASDSVTGNVTLYAKWTANSTPVPTGYTVTFDPNGGTGGGTVQTDTGGKLASGSIPANPAGDAAKKFLGWYDAQTGGTQIDPATHTFTVNTTLYARWSYAVTLDNNGFGQWGIGDAPTDPQTFWTDANGILTANSNNVSPSDLYSQSNDLMSWNSKQDGTGDSITDVNLTAHKFTAAGIWYAQWESY